MNQIEVVHCVFSILDFALQLFLVVIIATYIINQGVNYCQKMLVHLWGGAQDLLALFQDVIVDEVVQLLLLLSHLTHHLFSFLTSLTFGFFSLKSVFHGALSLFASNVYSLFSLEPLTLCLLSSLASQALGFFSL